MDRPASESESNRLAASLQRVEASLGRVGAPRGVGAPVVTPAQWKLLAPTAVFGLAVGLAGIGLVTNQPALVVAAVLLLVVGAFVRFTAVGKNLLSHLPGIQADLTRPSIGLGATIAAGATIEPGARVEMGADVLAGAVVRRGAIVRMGATIGAGAVIEANAVVSWGAEVGARAVVEAGATVGAGSTVGEGARVSAGTRLLPGSEWNGTSPTAAPPVAVAPSQPIDPRHVRIDAAADRLERDFERTPERLREFFGETGQTIGALRATCHDLVRREAFLRSESSPEVVQRLTEEQRGLQARLVRSTDEAVRASLRGALAAIDQQLQQRQSFERMADRLDAEVTRLMLVLEALSTQVVRLADVSAQPSSAAEVTGSVKRLHEEVEAVAAALEGLANEQLLEPVGEIGSSESTAVDSKVSVR